MRPSVERALSPTKYSVLRQVYKGTSQPHTTQPYNTDHVHYTALQRKAAATEPSARKQPILIVFFWWRQNGFQKQTEVTADCLVSSYFCLSLQNRYRIILTLSPWIWKGVSATLKFVKWQIPRFISKRMNYCVLREIHLTQFSLPVPIMVTQQTRYVDPVLV